MALVVKSVAVGLAIVAIVTLLVLAAVSRPPWRAPERCSGRVVIVRPLHGEPMECVCDAGVLSTCFSPGP
jgi:hypothetical protein